MDTSGLVAAFQSSVLFIDNHKGSITVLSHLMQAAAAVLLFFALAGAVITILLIYGSMYK